MITRFSTYWMYRSVNSGVTSSTSSSAGANHLCTVAARIASDPVRGLVPEQPVRADEQHDDDDAERRDLLERRRDVATEQHLDHADDQCADDRAWNAFEATQNGGGEPLEQEVRSHVGIEQRDGRCEHTGCAAS